MSCSEGIRDPRNRYPLICVAVSWGELRHKYCSDAALSEDSLCEIDAVPSLRFCLLLVHCWSCSPFMLKHSFGLLRKEESLSRSSLRVPEQSCRQTGRNC